MLQCLILDLDGTILNTSSLAELRDRGQWQEVYSKVSTCSIYPEIVELLNVARTTGFKIAVATKSPATYAKRLLAHFHIEVDSVVGFHDVRQQKPSPDCVHKILEQFKLEPSEAVYLGDSVDDQLCSANAGIEFFAVDWCSIDGVPQDRHGVGRLASYISASVKGLDASSGASRIQQNHNHFFLGYYLDGLKQEVWQFKDGAAPAVSRWTTKAASVVRTIPKIDFVVRALGHEELAINRKEAPRSLDLLGRQLAVKLGAKYAPELLSKNKVLKKSTKCSASERQAQVFGTYSINSEAIGIDGHTKLSFLIIDDVFTSGATTNEITRALRENYENATINVFTLVKTLYRADTSGASQEIRHNNQLFFDLYKEPTEAAAGDESTDSITAADNQSVSHQLINRDYSANYSNSNHNFIIQNLWSYSIASEPNSSKIVDGICILETSA